MTKAASTSAAPLSPLSTTTGVALVVPWPFLTIKDARRVGRRPGVDRWICRRVDPHPPVGRDQQVDPHPPVGRDQQVDPRRRWTDPPVGRQRGPVSRWACVRGWAGISRWAGIRRWAVTS